MLTQKQKDLLLLIDRKIKTVGVPPSYDEMKDALGLASKSGIHRLITAVEERGFIRRLPNKARALEVLKLPEDYNNAPAPVAANDEYEVPFVGKIAAGNPIAAIEDSYNMISVPPNMMGPDHFALEIEGESMIEAGILDGDIVVIKKANTVDCTLLLDARVREHDKNEAWQHPTSLAMSALRCHRPHRVDWGHFAPHGRLRRASLLAGTKRTSSPLK